MPPMRNPPAPHGPGPPSAAEAKRLLRRHSRLPKDGELPSLAFAEEMTTRDKKGIPSLNCFLSAAALLPQLTLCCGGRQAQVMGGRSGTGDGIIVQCTCQECEDRVACMPRFHPPAGRWAKLMTLEAFLEHGMGRVLLDRVDEHLSRQLCWELVHVNQPDGTTVPLRQFASETLCLAGGRTLMGRAVHLLWYADAKLEPEECLGRPDVRNRCPQLACPVGRWWLYKVVQVELDTGVVHVEYDDEERDTVVLGLCFMHWGLVAPNNTSNCYAPIATPCLLPMSRTQALDQLRREGPPLLSAAMQYRRSVAQRYWGPRCKKSTKPGAPAPAVGLTVPAVPAAAGTATVTPAAVTVPAGVILPGTDASATLADAAADMLAAPVAGSAAPVDASTALAMDAAADVSAAPVAASPAPAEASAALLGATAVPALQPGSALADAPAAPAVETAYADRSAGAAPGPSHEGTACAKPYGVEARGAVRIKQEPVEQQQGNKRKQQQHQPPRHLPDSSDPELGVSSERVRSMSCLVGSLATDVLVVVDDDDGVCVVGDDDRQPEAAGQGEELDTGLEQDQLAGQASAGCRVQPQWRQEGLDSGALNPENGQIAGGGNRKRQHPDQQGLPTTEAEVEAVPAPGGGAGVSEPAGGGTAAEAGDAAWQPAQSEQMRSRKRRHKKQVRPQRVCTATVSAASSEPALGHDAAGRAATSPLAGTLPQAIGLQPQYRMRPVALPTAGVAASPQQPLGGITAGAPVSHGPGRGSAAVTPSRAFPAAQPPAAACGDTSIPNGHCTGPAGLPPGTSPAAAAASAAVHSPRRPGQGPAVAGGLGKVDNGTAASGDGGVSVTAAAAAASSVAAAGPGASAGRAAAVGGPQAIPSSCPDDTPPSLGAAVAEVGARLHPPAAVRAEGPGAAPGVAGAGDAGGRPEACLPCHAGVSEAPGVAVSGGARAAGRSPLVGAAGWPTGSGRGKARRALPISVERPITSQSPGHKPSPYSPLQRPDFWLPEGQPSDDAPLPWAACAPGPSQPRTSPATNPRTSPLGARRNVMSGQGGNLSQWLLDIKPEPRDDLPKGVRTGWRKLPFKEEPTSPQSARGPGLDAALHSSRAALGAAPVAAASLTQGSGLTRGTACAQEVVAVGEQGSQRGGQRGGEQGDGQGGEQGDGQGGQRGSEQSDGQGGEQSDGQGGEQGDGHGGQQGREECAAGHGKGDKPQAGDHGRAQGGELDHGHSSAQVAVRCTLQGAPKGSVHCSGAAEAVGCIELCASACSLGTEQQQHVQIPQGTPSDEQQAQQVLGSEPCAAQGERSGICIASPSLPLLEEQQQQQQRVEQRLCQQSVQEQEERQEQRPEQQPGPGPHAGQQLGHRLEQQPQQQPVRQSRLRKRQRPQEQPTQQLEQQGQQQPEQSLGQLPKTQLQRQQEQHPEQQHEQQSEQLQAQQPEQQLVEQPKQQPEQQFDQESEQQPEQHPDGKRGQQPEQRSQKQQMQQPEPLQMQQPEQQPEDHPEVRLEQQPERLFEQQSEQRSEKQQEQQPEPRQTRYPEQQPEDQPEEWLEQQPERHSEQQPEQQPEQQLEQQPAEQLERQSEQQLPGQQSEQQHLGQQLEQQPEQQSEQQPAKQLERQSEQQQPEQQPEQQSEQQPAQQPEQQSEQQPAKQPEEQSQQQQPKQQSEQQQQEQEHEQQQEQQREQQPESTQSGDLPNAEPDVTELPSTCPGSSKLPTTQSGPNGLSSLEPGVAELGVACAAEVCPGSELVVGSGISVVKDSGPQVLLGSTSLASGSLTPPPSQPGWEDAQTSSPATLPDAGERCIATEAEVGIGRVSEAAAGLPQEGAVAAAGQPAGDVTCVIQRHSQNSKGQEQEEAQSQQSSQQQQQQHSLASPHQSPEEQQPLPGPLAQMQQQLQIAPTPMKPNQQQLAYLRMLQDLASAFDLPAAGKLIASEAQRRGAPSPGTPASAWVKAAAVACGVEHVWVLLRPAMVVLLHLCRGRSGPAFAACWEEAVRQLRELWQAACLVDTRGDAPGLPHQQPSAQLTAQDHLERLIKLASSRCSANANLEFSTVRDLLAAMVQHAGRAGQAGGTSPSVMSSWEYITRTIDDNSNL